jgi:hypothetical protein
LAPGGRRVKERKKGDIKRPRFPIYFYLFLSFPLRPPGGHYLQNAQGHMSKTATRTLV